MDFFYKLNQVKTSIFSPMFFHSFRLDWDYFVYGFNLILFIVLIFYVGAAFCGFFQCMIYRHKNRINLFIARSFCDACGKTLRWPDPAPVINYLVLKGKCRYCGFALPPWYFYAELLSGIIFLLLIVSPLHIVYTLPSALILVYGIALGFYSLETL